MDFGNFRGIVMLVKHILVFTMIALGFWFNAIMRVGPIMSSNNPEQVITRFRKYVNGMATRAMRALLLRLSSRLSKGERKIQ